MAVDDNGGNGAILGAVLAGGRSSRFGSDKAAALFDGRPLLAHAAALLAPVTDAVVVVGRGDVPDLPEPGLGPLGGLAGALAYGQAQGFASVLTIGCDMPRLPDGLLDSLSRRAPSFCPDAPVLGHWPTALAPALLDYLKQSPDRSVRRWAQAAGALPIAAPGPLANVNTPADMAAL